jgi:hypothetical protein
MKTPILLLAALLATTSVARAQSAAEKVTVRVFTERTAVWTGDRVQYTLEFMCPGALDVLPEDLAKERLPLRGAEVLTVDTAEESVPNGTIRRVRYNLATYAVDVKEITIDAFTVRYFSRRTIGATTQTAPQGEIGVPRTIIAIRSTLPDSGRLPDFRTPAGLRQAPRYARFARPVGWALVAIAILPVALVVLDVAGRLRRLRAGTPRRRVKRQHTTEIEELSNLSPGTADERVRAFERLDRVVRQHIELTTGIPALALTPGEIARALRERPGPTAADDIEALLDTCERARYAADPIQGDEWDRSLRAAEGVVRGRP